MAQAVILFSMVFEMWKLKLSYDRTPPPRSLGTSTVFDLKLEKLNDTLYDKEFATQYETSN